MIRKIIRPQNSSFTINIPTDYINREVEFIMSPLDEQKINNNIKHQKQKSLKGVFNQYADSSKISLEDKAWSNHLINSIK